jgi:hypothetical protein
MSVYMMRLTLEFSAIILAMLGGVYIGYGAGRRRERMSTLDLTSLHYHERPQHDPFGVQDAHLTKYRSATLSPVVTGRPVNATNLEDALKQHIRQRR